MLWGNDASNETINSNPGENYKPSIEKEENDFCLSFFVWVIKGFISINCETCKIGGIIQISCILGRYLIEEDYQQEVKLFPCIKIYYWCFTEIFNVIVVCSLVSAEYIYQSAWLWWYCVITELQKWSTQSPPAG